MLHKDLTSYLQKFMDFKWQSGPQFQVFTLCVRYEECASTCESGEEVGSFAASPEQRAGFLTEGRGSLRMSVALRGICPICGLRAQAGDMLLGCCFGEDNVSPNWRTSTGSC